MHHGGTIASFERLSAVFLRYRMKKLTYIIAVLAMGAGGALAQTPVAPTAQPPNKPAAKTQDASYGLASFYGHKSQTTSGEKSNARELTAAHRTLPFGTRVRVTNVATGRSVTVLVNDRGPFVTGRIVDVSYSAAEMLGIIGRGVAKVKLDVVQ
jgi:rare lipoprotein A